MNAASIALHEVADQRGGRIINKEKTRLLCYATLALADSISTIAAFGFANLIYIGQLDSDHGIVMVCVLLPIYLVVAAFSRVYSARMLSSSGAGIFAALWAFAVSACAILFIAYFLKAGGEFSRAVFSIGVSVSAFLLIGVRLLLRRPLLKLLDGSPLMVVVLRDVKTNREEKFRLVGQLSDDSSDDYIEVTGSSPIGVALMKARIGETVRVDLPKGERRFLIVKIEG